MTLTIAERLSLSHCLVVKPFADLAAYIARLLPSGFNAALLQFIGPFPELAACLLAAGRSYDKTNCSTD